MLLARMNAKELSDLAKKGQVEEILAQLFSGEPFAFNEKPAEYSKFREQISAALKCESANVIVVGSGRFGFSLAPHKFGRPFHDRSDIDVIIVDPNFFDVAWIELIRYDAKSLTFAADVAESLREHRTNNVFWGYLEPYNLKAALSTYQTVWFPMVAGWVQSTAGWTRCQWCYWVCCFGPSCHRPWRSHSRKFQRRQCISQRIAAPRLATANRRRRKASGRQGLATRRRRAPYCSCHL